jgi:hypothetical protein
MSFQCVTERSVSSHDHENALRRERFVTFTNVREGVAAVFKQT